MIIVPDIDLPKELEYNYDLELHKFIEECVEGIKYITIHRKLSKDRYESVAKIDFENKTPNIKQRPPEKIEDICKVIMSIIQVDIEARDEDGIYRAQCFRNSGKPNGNIKSKHINVRIGEHNAYINDHVSYNEEPENLNFTNLQLEHIKQLQEQNIKTMNVIFNFTAALIEDRKNMQNMVSDMMRKSEVIERLNAERYLLERETELRNKLEETKIVNNKERWDKALNMIEKTGAAKGLLDAITKKLLSGTPELSDDIIEKQKQKQPTPTRSRVQQAQSPIKPTVRVTEIDPENVEMNVQAPTSSNPQNQNNSNQVIISEDERLTEEPISLSEEEMREIDQMLENEPLRCYVNILGARLTSEQREACRTALGNEIYIILESLLMSSSEEDALKNLIVFQDLYKQGKLKLDKIQTLYGILDDKQQELISKILSYKID